MLFTVHRTSGRNRVQINWFIKIIFLIHYKIQSEYCLRDAGYPVEPDSQNAICATVTQSFRCDWEMTVLNEKFDITGILMYRLMSRHAILMSCDVTKRHLCSTTTHFVQIILKICEEKKLILRTCWNPTLTCLFTNLPQRLRSTVLCLFR